MKKKKDLEKELEKIIVQNYKLEAEFWKEYYEFRILLNKTKELTSKEE